MHGSLLPGCPLHTPLMRPSPLPVLPDPLLPIAVLLFSFSGAHKGRGHWLHSADEATLFATSGIREWEGPSPPSVADFPCHSSTPSDLWSTSLQTTLNRSRWLRSHLRVAEPGGVPDCGTLGQSVPSASPERPATQGRVTAPPNRSLHRREQWTELEGACELSSPEHGGFSLGCPAQSHNSREL